jgi:uncharacterized lipoprotein YddW (UPF0748 family)
MLLALLLAASAAAPAAPREMRGLWVVRTGLVSPASVDAVVDQAVAGGFNALFVQVRGRGDAFYSSRLVPRSDLLRQQPSDFDPLARLIEKARPRGLAIHAWVNVLLTSHFPILSAENVVSRHPEWVMVPRLAAGVALPADPQGLLRRIRRAAQGDPDVEGYYLSPSAPGAPEHLEGVVRELLRGYSMDGLHLDFIRYPGPDYDYSQAGLLAFARREGVKAPLSVAASRPAAWNDFRREALTALVERLVAAARSERPQLVLSAAVVPDRATAFSQKFQDWPDWLARGLLDAVCPMAYTADDRVFRAQVRDAQGQIRAGQAVWAGVGAYRLDVAGIVGKIQLARAEGASGVVLFSHESLGPAALRALRAQAFVPVATLPVRRIPVGGQ